MFIYFQYSKEPINHSGTVQTNTSVIDPSDSQSAYANSNAVNQSASNVCQTSAPVNGVENQEFSVADVRELMYHIQWLQTQLRQVF